MTDTPVTQEELLEIHRKLDIILEEMALQRRHRQEMEDLKDDLMRVGKDLYQTAVVELEEVHDHLDTGDIVHLAKRLLRNVKNLTRTVEQLESVRDFVQDFSPVSRDLFLDMLRRLDELDRKGYFVFMRELSGVFDRVVTSFTTEDVRIFGENIVTILNTVKTLTQPDILRAVNNALNVYKKMDIRVQEDVSLFSLLREANTPEVRKGLAFAIRLLKTLAAQEERESHVFTPSHVH